MCQITDDLNGGGQELLVLREIWELLGETKVRQAGTSVEEICWYMYI